MEQTKIILENYFQESPDHIKKILHDECSAIKERYQTDLSYKQEQLGTDLLAFYNKISFYTQIVERLLCEFEYSEKLGEIVKIINDCLMNVFRFVQDHTKKRKNYIADRIIELEDKLRIQVPGHCNRCKKFIMSRDIEETKVLIGAGQFKDPFNLFEMGMSDLLLNHKMQEDIEYKLKYAEVWDNKRKIEEKLQMMLIDCDKKSYSISFTVSEIEKLENVIKTIANQFALNKDNIEKRDGMFTENLEKLVKIVFYKIKSHQNLEKIDEEIQTESDEILKIEEIKKNNIKLNKKIEDLSKKITSKEKEITNITEKFNQQNEINSKALLEKNSMEIVMKNLITQHVEETKRIESLLTEKKEQQIKIKFLEKEIDYVKNENDKLNEQITNNNFYQKNNQFLTPETQNINQKSMKSFKYLKSKKQIKEQQTSEENTSLTLNQNLRTKWRNSNDSSVNESLKKSKIRESIKKNENYEKSSIKFINQEENEEIILSKKNANKKNTELRELSTFSAEKNSKQDFTYGIESDNIKSRVSIALETEYLNDESHKKIEEQPKSVKKSRNLMKSVRKIQKNKKNQESDEPHEDSEYYLMEGNLTTVSHKKIKDFQEKSTKSASRVNETKKEYATQTDDNPSYILKNHNKDKPSETNPLKIPQKEKLQKTKQLIRHSNNKQTLKNENKENKKLHSTTLPILNNNENHNKNNPNESIIKQELEEFDAVSKVFHLYEKKANIQKNEMQFQGSFNNFTPLTIDNFQLYFDEFLDNLLTKEKLENEFRRTSTFKTPKTAPVSPKKIKENIEKKLEPLSLHRFSSLNEQSQFHLQKNPNSLNFSLSNGFSRWEKNSENSTHTPPFTMSIYQTPESTTKEIYLNEISEKLTKMYFSPEEAEQVEKSKYSADYIETHEKEEFQKKERKSLHKNSMKIKPNFINDMLTKNEVKYMNIIIVFLMKLHDTFPEAYETIKKIITHPFTSQNNKMFKIKNQENSYISEENKNNLTTDSSPIRDGIAKLILLHRNCNGEFVITRNSIKNNGNLIGTELKKVSDWKENSIHKERQSINIKHSLCKHLQEFETCLQKDININFKNKTNENNINN